MGWKATETVKNDEAWVLGWSKKIPRFTKGCSCKEHWNAWYPKNKPDYKKENGYFEWTVKAHNAVNARLKKKQFTVDEAREFYKDLK